MRTIVCINALRFFVFFTGAITLTAHAAQCALYNIYQKQVCKKKIYRLRSFFSSHLESKNIYVYIKYNDHSNNDKLIYSV